MSYRNNLTIFVLFLLIVILIPLFIFLNKEAGAADWKDAGECFVLINQGRKEDIIRDSKAILRSDRWNVNAYTCMAMAYYYRDKYISIKKLREAEDTLPKEVVGMIHDSIWNYLPELLAEKEYMDNYTISGGDCILRNVTGLKGTGYLIIGDYLNPYDYKVTRHVRGYRCTKELQTCEDIDLVCPECKIINAEVLLVVRDYRLSDVFKFKAGIEISRNLRYITRILELQRDRQ